MFFPWLADAGMPQQPLEQDRIFGRDRYETAVALSREIYDIDQSADAVVLVRGDLATEGLVAGPLASVLNASILLTKTGDLPAATRQEMQRILPTSKEVWILGGDRAISPGVEVQVQQLGYSTRRIIGETRVETAARVAEEVLSRAAPSKAYLVNGWSGADAFIASNVATHQKVPVLLSRQSGIDPSLGSLLSKHASLDLHAIGGPAVLSNALINELKKNHDVTWTYGANRFATNIQAVAGMSSIDLAFGNADRPLDLLVGGAVAGRFGVPLLLVRENLAPETQQYLQDNHEGMLGENLIGGEAVISANLAKRLRYFRKTKDEAMSFMSTRLKTTAAQLPVGIFPFASTDPSGTWNFVVKGKDFVEGFWVDWLYQVGEITGDAALVIRAKADAVALTPFATYPHHDLGFVFFPSHAKLCDATGEQQFCDTAIQAADTLASLFDPALHVITTTPGSREAIIDTTVNTVLLYWASDYTGNSSYRSIADETNHTLANLLIRPDGSTAQSVHFNADGSVEKIHTHQGYSDNSTWARGQAWALLSMIFAYEFTNDSYYIDRAREVFDYLEAQHKKFAGLWPYDFSASDVTHVDASAMTVAMEALTLLADSEPDSVRATKAQDLGEELLDRVTRQALVPTLQAADPDGRVSKQTYTYPDSLEFIVGDYFLYQALSDL